jgi:mono/diheme cytochrome c family protein
MKYLVWILLPFSLMAKEAFISYYEYGQMLYQNPRGISCVECHGDYGEGRVILEYQEGKERRILRGADIRQSSVETMRRQLNSYHKVMPRYYLTNREIQAIHDYLKRRSLQSD